MAGSSIASPSPPLITRSYDPDSAKTLQCERHEGVFTMTLAHGTDRLDRLARLRRIAPDDLPFFTRIHALPESRGQNLYPGGRPRSPKETAACFSTLSRA